MRFLFGKLGKDWQLKLANLYLHVHLSIQIAKFKFCQYQLRAVSPNLMLVKVPAIRYVSCSIVMKAVGIAVYVHVQGYPSPSSKACIFLCMYIHPGCAQWQWYRSEWPRSSPSWMIMSTVIDDSIDKSLLWFELSLGTCASLFIADAIVAWPSCACVP